MTLPAKSPPVSSTSAASSQPQLASLAETARRLSAVMEYLNMDSVREFAEFLGAQRSQVSNWLQGYHFPRVTEMARLCEKMGNQITLDWIYRGVQSGMPYGMVVHLQAFLGGVQGPAAPSDLKQMTAAVRPVGLVAVKKKRRGPRRVGARPPA